jgi:amino acid adenylation domain-containing protein
LGPDKQHPAAVPFVAALSLQQVSTSDSIQGLFEAEASKYPHSIAVTWGDSRLTYAELNQRANQLAHYLRQVGVGPEISVGICLPRSLSMVVAALGVLKAGGAYVPLDPTYPAERLEFMVADARPRVLLTDDGVAAKLPEHSARVIRLDADSDAINSQPDDNPVNLTRPEHLVYVIYTSGSTGRPKGVLIQHGSLLNAYQGWEREYRLRSVCAHLQMASFSFDVFAGDLVRALCSGGKLVLCPREYLLVPEKLYALMRREQVDAAEFVPAVMRKVADYVRRSGHSLDFMRLLVVGSDVWTVHEYQQLQALCGPKTRVINSYGVTEATIDSSYFEGSIGGPPEQSLPIGRAFPNTVLRVLDEQFRPVAPGEEGELHIGGAGLARGYLNNPELTTERFIEDPWSRMPGSRFYRTGDRARLLPDGNVELLGRRDDQVKISGYRIEVSEIEAVLRRHAAVRQAVVLPEVVGHRKRLVAYVVHEQAEGGEPEKLRRFLRAALPRYMVPSAVIPLDMLPLTHNGKIDRRALAIQQPKTPLGPADSSRHLPCRGATTVS